MYVEIGILDATRKTCSITELKLGEISLSTGMLFLNIYYLFPTGRLQMWTRYRWTAVLGASVNLALQKIFPQSLIINRLDLSETFDVVSSQLLENYYLNYFFYI